MTSLHRKWSPKVAIPTTKGEDGGVAACLNWSYGTRLRKQKDASSTNEAALKFQDAVDRVLDDLSTEKENAVRNLTTPEPELVRFNEDRRVLTPRDNLSRSGTRPPTPADLLSSKAERTRSRAEYLERELATERRIERENEKLERELIALQRGSRTGRAATPGVCTHVRPSERVEAWADKRDRTDAYDEKKPPLDSTKKFLKKYFNRPLTDDELRKVLSETHRRISDDIVEAALDERDTERRPRGRVPKPPAAKSCSIHKRNGYNQRKTGPVRAVAVPRKDYRLQLANEDDRQRPLSAQYTSRDNHVTWNTGVHSRPGSASLPVHSHDMTSQGKHLASWRPSSTTPNYPWTQSSNNYDDLWRLTNKYNKKASSMRYEPPKQLGTSRYHSNNHRDAERDYLENRPASQQGKVNVQLDCPDNSDMMVSVRVQKSRASTSHEPRANMRY